MTQTSDILYAVVAIGGYLFNAAILGRVATMYFREGRNMVRTRAILAGYTLGLVWPAALVFLILLVIFMSTARTKEQS